MNHAQPEATQPDKTRAAPIGERLLLQREATPARYGIRDGKATTFSRTMKTTSPDTEPDTAARIDALLASIARHLDELETRIGGGQ